MRRDVRAASDGRGLGATLTLKATFERAVAVLEDAGVAYMAVGSVAAAYHGMIRSTQDVDLVLEVDRQSMSEVVAGFDRAGFYVSEEAARDALRRRGMLNVMDMSTGWKVDLIVRKNRPFSTGEFGRRVQGDVMGVNAWFASAEDTILVKLEWGKASESERQVRDAAGIVGVQQDRLDLDYLDRWAAELDVLDLWRTVRP